MISQLIRKHLFIKITYDDLLQKVYQYYFNKKVLLVDIAIDICKDKYPYLEISDFNKARNRINELIERGYDLAEYYRNNKSSFNSDWEETKTKIIKLFGNDFPEFSDEQLKTVFCHGLFLSR